MTKYRKCVMHIFNSKLGKLKCEAFIPIDTREFIRVHFYRIKVVKIISNN